MLTSPQLLALLHALLSITAMQPNAVTSELTYAEEGVQRFPPGALPCSVSHRKHLLAFSPVSSYGVMGGAS